MFHFITPRFLEVQLDFNASRALGMRKYSALCRAQVQVATTSQKCTLSIFKYGLEWQIRSALSYREYERPVVYFANMGGRYRSLTTWEVGTVPRHGSSVLYFDMRCRYSTLTWEVRSRERITQYLALKACCKSIQTLSFWEKWQSKVIITMETSTFRFNNTIYWFKIT